MIWADGSVVEFRLCNLWSLVRFPVLEITVYTADETYEGRNICPVFPYVERKYSPDFSFMVIQFSIKFLFLKRENVDLVLLREIIGLVRISGKRIFQFYNHSWLNVHHHIKILLEVTLPIEFRRSARRVMVIVVGYGHGDTSSNPGRDWLHFT